MLSSKTFGFLKALKKNNNREWFNEHKNDYLDAKEEFEAFVDDLIDRIGKFDKDIAELTARDCVFRIYKDIRFSKDKSPYKTNMGAWMVKGGKKAESGAGYYLHIEPGGCFLGGGAYMPPPDWLKALRNHIYRKWKVFDRIRSDKKFKKLFSEMEAETLKRLPPGFDPVHPASEVLKQKHFVVLHRFPDKQAASASFVQYCADGFKAMQPFNKFLNETLK